MRYRKAITTTAGTLGCAFSIGFFMQQSSGAHSVSPNHQGQTLLNSDAAVLNVESIILTSAEFADDFISPKAEETVALAVSEEIVTPLIAEELPVRAAEDVVPEATVKSKVEAEPACHVTAAARPIAAAMVNLTLEASCLPNEPVTVHHNGLLFNQTTDVNGAFDIAIPAMAHDAVFIVAFTDGEGAIAQTRVVDLSEFDRIALQWKGDTGFHLHAREFGADYGSEGHVWSGAARDMSYAVTGEGGYISLLGDTSVPDGLLAEVYTFPTNIAQNAGKIELSVETKVASNNCGLEIEAQTLQTRSGFEITSRDLTLSVPDCEAAGNFLVLNNFFEDLKVASN